MNLRRILGMGTLLCLAGSTVNAQEHSVIDNLNKIRNYAEQNSERTFRKGPNYSQLFDEVNLDGTEIEVSNGVTILETSKNGKTWRFYDTGDQSTLDRLIVVDGDVLDREEFLIDGEGIDGVHPATIGNAEMLGVGEDYSNFYRTRNVIDMVEGKSYLFGKDGVSTSPLNNKVKESFQRVYESVIKDVADKITK